MKRRKMSHPSSSPSKVLEAVSDALRALPTSHTTARSTTEPPQRRGKPSRAEIQKFREALEGKVVAPSLAQIRM
jgi:hypothetical protein